MPIQRLGEQRPQIDPSAVVSPTATIVGDVRIGPGCSVWPGAVLRGDFGPIRIGAETNIQDNAVLHAGEDGTYVGKRCLVAHLAFIESATVEDDCMVAIGSLVLPGARLRRGSATAAGAVLTRALEVPTGMRAQGVPARLVAGGDIRAQTELSRRAYGAMARRYRDELHDVDDGEPTYRPPNP